MAIEVSREAKGIYIARWQGDVQSDDLYLAGDQLLAYAREDAVEQYTLMIDGTEITKLPVAMQAYVRTTHDICKQIVILNSPRYGEMMGRMVNRLLPVTMEFYQDRDEWRAAAYRLSGQTMAQS